MTRKETKEYALGMQKSLLLLTVIFLTLFTASPVSALTPKETFQASMSAARMQMKESMQARKAAFQEKLKTIKDAKKQSLLERIVNKITTFNTTQTTRMTSNLEKLTSLITSFEEKVVKAKAAGQDTTSAEAAISSAKTALASAKTAVAAQLIKDYTITINTENTLRNDVGAVMSQFRSDMQTTHKAVVDAKQAVMQVAKEMAKLRGEKTEPSITTTQ